MTFTNFFIVQINNSISSLNNCNLKSTNRTNRRTILEQNEIKLTINLFTVILIPLFMVYQQYSDCIFTCILMKIIILQPETLEKILSKFHMAKLHSGNFGIFQPSPSIRNSHSSIYRALKIQKIDIKIVTIPCNSRGENHV